ncbi:hypothetical protein HD806DRAFT_520092 [Xylariaceae sp. AK1471]|nr:hypothetical protein HD806DRAFT_520092 [Xylariaceae sp. AK1471]
MRFPIQPGTPQIEYHRLRLSEQKPNAENDESARESPKRPVWAIIITYTTIAALAVSLATVSILHMRLLRQQSPQKEAHRQLLTCGKSVEEARRAGCSFDRLTKTWLHAGCPRYYEQEFLQFPSTLNMTEWKYWTDTTVTKEITDEDMALAAQTQSRHETLWFSTVRMHLAHCAFGLMRRSDTLDAGERLDFATAPLDHTKHCIELLLEYAMLAPGIDTTLAGGGVIFGAC